MGGGTSAQQNAADDSAVAVFAKMARDENPGKESGMFLVTARTGDQEGSGTDQDVYLRLVGALGSSPEAKLDSENNFWRNDFESGRTTAFQVGMAGADPIGDIVAIELRVEGSGDLYLTSVSVQRLLDPEEGEDEGEDEGEGGEKQVVRARGDLAAARAARRRGAHPASDSALPPRAPAQTGTSA